MHSMVLKMVFEGTKSLAAELAERVGGQSLNHEIFFKSDIDYVFDILSLLDESILR